MKSLFVITIISALLYACSGNTSSSNSTSTNDTSGAKSVNPDAISQYDPHRGEGKFSNVEVGPLNVTMADAGKKVYDVKCSSCHKLTNEKLVGPGWSGITQKQTPEWIMNFITNPDAMIDKDPELQAQLEICLVRMPNQNLNDEDARSVLEFMRKNDGVK